MKWICLRLPNCEKFTLSAQTAEAMKKTLLCQAALIEDLLNNGFNFVLTARFQSDPLERRYGQYRQMSGGRFLVSLKDIQTSEKILKIKSLVQEGIDIDAQVKSSNFLAADDVRALLSEVEEKVLNGTATIMLSDISKEISNHIAGYIERKMKAVICDECPGSFDSTDYSSTSYTSNLSRGGLVFASDELGDYVAQSFAYLDASSSLIRQSKIPARRAAEEILSILQCRPRVFCKQHEVDNMSKADRIISNIFFNNQRKRVTDSDVKDGVETFKRNKRQKTRETL